MGLFKYADGWGPLFERASLRTLTNTFNAMDAKAHVTADAQINAYLKLSPKLQQVADALTSMLEALQPTIIGKTEFVEACRESAAVIAYAMHSSLDTFVVPVPQGFKSNLWVFLIVAKELEKMYGNWKRDRDRLLLYVMDRRQVHFDKPIHLLMIDDCVYSGEQMGRFGEQCTRRLNVSAVTLLPMFATLDGLTSVRQQMRRRMSVHVAGNIIDYPDGALATLKKSDVAICVGTGQRWIVMSLFAVLHIMKYSHDGKKLKGKLSGTTATVFRHKLADALSVPTDALLVGPTLRDYLTQQCAFAPCDFEAPVQIVTMKFKDWMGAFNRVSEENLNWLAVGFGAFSCSDAFMKAITSIVDDTHDAGKCVLSKMPMYAPLLQPADTCGKQVAAALKVGNDRDGDVWNQLEVDEMIYGKARCIMAPYKAVLRRLVGTTGELAQALLEQRG